MSKTIIRTDRAPAAIGPYSQAVLIGGILYVSGQIGMDPTSGELVPGGTAAQAKQVLANLGAVLEAGGANVGDLAKVTIYLTDLSEFALVNEIYAQFVGDTMPARATVQVSALPKGASVEIDAIAHVGGAL